MKDPGNQEIIEAVKKERYLELVKAARDDFEIYCKLMMPHPDDPDDPDMTLYHVAAHHKLLIGIVEKIDKGEIPRIIVTMPPRHGKTETLSKLGLSWMYGRNPHESFVIGTYNSDFAGDFGRDVRAMVQSDVFKAIFPKFELRKGSAAANRLTTINRGQATFVGAGGALTGRGFHKGLIDDPFKDAAEADSQLVRDKRWDWFTKVFMTRQMTVGSSVIVVLTRWHEDDIVGRLTDPNNPHYNEDEGKQWKILNLPFFAEENDPLGRTPNEVLWPERFTREFGEAQRRLNPRGFQALYQQRPTAQEGTYFKKAWLEYYETAPDRKELTVYAASDHAVATAEHNDKTCMVVVGVDKAGQIYFLDCVWGRYDAQQQVDHMIALMKKWEPSLWWAEKQHMGAALGPFLRKKKLESGVSCVVEEVHASKDKESRARSLQGLMSDGRILFPKRGWWRLAAEDEVLKFPQGTYDDFVDAAAWMGMKIQQMYAARVIKSPDAPARNSWAWWKKQLEFEEREMRHKKITGGW